MEGCDDLIRYSLLDGFRGSLLGLALGEELGAYSSSPRSPTKLAAETTRTVPLQHWRPGLMAEQMRASAEPLCYWSTQAVLEAESLIRAGDGVPAPAQGLDSSFIRSNGTPALSLTSQKGITGAELAIATLPLVLFFHDDAIKLRQKLSQRVLAWNGDAEVQAEVLAVGYPIAQALKQQLFPATLLSQILDYLQAEIPDVTGVGATDRIPSVIRQLERVQTLLDQRADLHTAMAELSQRQQSQDVQAIGLAFYCFLSTPDDLRLAMMRAAHSVDRPQWVCAIVGAIAGAYNGGVAIPLAWSMNASTTAPVLGAGKSVLDLQQLATRLLAAWSGAYDSTAFSEQVPAIAAPDVIRPR